MGADYSRGLLRQVEDLTLENDALRDANKVLRAENQTLKAENRSLRGRLETLEASLDAKVAQAAERVVAPVRAKVAELEQAVAAKDAEIDRLKTVIQKDSSNSSKPPGSNGFKKIPNSREKSGKKAGGQPGHPGHCLRVPENLGELVSSGKAEHKIVDHTGGKGEYVSKWVVDAKVKVVYTEHRYPLGTEFSGGERTAVRYGKELQGLAVLLAETGAVAYERLGDFFGMATGGLVAPSDGMLLSTVGALAGSLDGDMAAIRDELRNATEICTDDTPVRCSQKLERGESGEAELTTAEKTTFSAYIRTYSTGHATLYTANSRKNAGSIDADGLLPGYQGTLVHDNEAKFYKYGSRHGTCGGHLLRDLKGLRDLWKIGWTDGFRSFMQGMNERKNEDIANGRLECSRGDLDAYSMEYDRLLAEGNALLGAMPPRAFGRGKLRNMLNRLGKFKDSYLLFIEDYRVPFTNNLAERDLRPFKTKQKISGCFRTMRGLQDHAKIMSAISTWKKKGKDVLQEIIARLPEPTLLCP